MKKNVDCHLNNENIIQHHYEISTNHQNFYYDENKPSIINNKKRTNSSKLTKDEIKYQRFVHDLNFLFGL